MGETNKLNWQNINDGDVHGYALDDLVEFDMQLGSEDSDGFTMRLQCFSDKRCDRNVRGFLTVFKNMEADWGGVLRSGEQVACFDLSYLDIDLIVSFAKLMSFMSAHTGNPVPAVSKLVSKGYEE